MLSCAGLSAGVEPAEGEALNGEANGRVEARVARIRGKREKRKREWERKKGARREDIRRGRVDSFS